MLRIDLNTTKPGTVLAQTCDILKQGGLVIFPTETTYGAGVDATNPKAVDRLLRYKSRREGKPLSIAVSSQSMAEQYVELNEQARTLYQQFLPGPLTVISKARAGAVAPGVVSEFNTLGVRIPAYTLILDLVSHFGKPLTATSANASGKARPYQIDALLRQLSEKQKSQIDLILDAGKLPANPPSTVIDTTLSTPLTVRQGKLKLASDDAVEQLTTHSPEETKQIGGKLLLRHWNQLRNQGLLITLDGQLGTGKTVFAQGAGEFLGLQQPLTSPTYTYIEEYPYTRHGVTGVLYHLDLWKVDSTEQLERLHLADLFQPNNLILIEWSNPHESYLNSLASSHNTPLISVTIQESEQDDNKRSLLICQPTTI
ncbi:threonylcarbamoyl-AMP synthase [Candidatus Woesebacteria bacterium]|nr:threonylcarbamoyl-AMP synthase [Candidatus Woesebacteria bacterium]